MIDFTNDNGESSYIRDIKIDEAVNSLRQYFEDNRQRVFYSTFLETLYERQYFHWITAKALKELATSKQIQREIHEVKGNHIRFFFHRSFRYPKREINQMLKVLEKIHDSKFTHALGDHSELIIDRFLAVNGFALEPGRDLQSWGTRFWTKTNHNLDRIATRGGSTYGIEIKNTQNYISKEEFETKLEMCNFLELVPLFIMRAAPASYINQAYKQGGICLLYETQLYPFNHEELVTEVKTVLGLKIASPRDLEGGVGARFDKWEAKKNEKQKIAR